MSTTNPYILSSLLRAREPKEKKKPAGLGNSDKLKELLKQYGPIAKEFLAKPENQECAIKMPGCTKKATCVHHAAGRSGNKLIDVTDFIASCNNCNREVELHDALAREKGFKRTRLGKVNK